MQTPTIAVINHESNHSPERSSLTTRKSATMHKNLITKLRPLPFQYVWSVYYEKSTSTTPSNGNTSSSSTYTDRLTTLSSSVPDIAEFYKVFNNIPWSSVPSRSSIHIFRSGVQPVWEDPENLNGGCFTLKIRKPTTSNNADDADRPRRVWEEICLMGCGGELQAAVVDAGSRDHVLGMSFSPRLYWVHVSVWMKGVGDGEKGWQAVQKTVLERLSPELKPKSEGEYYYKRHDEHDGWAEAVGNDKGNGEGTDGQCK